MPETPYTNMDAVPESRGRACCKWVLKILIVFLVTVFLLAGLLQIMCYEWATMNCKAGPLKDYDFPGGGPHNLVPAHSLITQQEPRWWGSSFISIPADEDGQAQGASTGVYYRTWGPLFWTVTYQDIMSKETFVMRDRPLAIGGSHQIRRCDGEGPVYIVTEGTHVLMNLIRSIFGMYSSRVYNIWEDNKVVAVSSKLGGTGQSHKQMVFREPDHETPFASSFLKSRHFHGHFDEWFVQIDEKSPVPNFVPNAITVLMAFVTAGEKAKPNKHKSDKDDDKEAVDYAEVAEDDVLQESEENVEQQQPKADVPAPELAAPAAAVQLPSDSASAEVDQVQAQAELPADSRDDAASAAAAAAASEAADADVNVEVDGRES